MLHTRVGRHRLRFPRLRLNFARSLWIFFIERDTWRQQSHLCPHVSTSVASSSLLTSIGIGQCGSSTISYPIGSSASLLRLPPRSGFVVGWWLLGGLPLERAVGILSAHSGLHQSRLPSASGCLGRCVFTRVSCYPISIGLSRSFFMCICIGRRVCRMT